MHKRLFGRSLWTIRRRGGSGSPGARTAPASRLPGRPRLGGPRTPAPRPRTRSGSVPDAMQQDFGTLRIRMPAGRERRDVVAVTFPGLRAQSKDLPGFAEEFLARRGLPAIHVTVAENHWFQVPEIEPALACVRDLCRPYARVVTYGSSMGGYGALLAAPRVGAQAAIAMCPQVSIDGRKVPWERRWRDEAAGLAFGWDEIGPGPEGTCAAFLLYDPRHKFDRRHVAAIRALWPAAEAIVTPFGGHKMPMFLRQAGIIGDLVAGLIAGEFGVREARRRVRLSRLNSANYLANRARVLARKGWPEPEPRPTPSGPPEP